MYVAQLAQRDHELSDDGDSDVDSPDDEQHDKILSSAALVMAVLLSLLVGLALVVRSLKNVKLVLNLKLKRDDSAEKKY